MILQSLAGLPAFLVYFCTAIIAVVLYLLIYTRITPHNEFQLIRDNDPAAAIALGLSLLGFTLPVVSAIAHSDRRRPARARDLARTRLARGRRAQRRLHDHLMTTGKRLTEFGKRQPTPLPPVPGPKRSNHVALLVMGTLAVGGGAYALMPNSCQPMPPGTAAPGMSQADAGCVSRGGAGGGSGGYSRSSRFSFFGNSGASSPAAETSGGVTRGGFGSFAHAMGFGGGGE
jgi:hypothetical protein